MPFLIVLFYLVGAYITWTSYTHKTQPEEGMELLASFFVFQAIWPIGFLKLILDCKKIKTYNVRLTFVPYLQLDAFRKTHHTDDPYKVFIWLCFKLTWKIKYL